MIAIAPRSSAFQLLLWQGMVRRPETKIVFAFCCETDVCGAPGIESIPKTKEITSFTTFFSEKLEENLEKCIVDFIIAQKHCISKISVVKVNCRTELVCALFFFQRN